MAGRDYSERHRQRRGKNYAVAFLLLSLVVVLYVVFLARAGSF